jgi:hypothetical protein
MTTTPRATSKSQRHPIRIVDSRIKRLSAHSPHRRSVPVIVLKAWRWMGFGQLRPPPPVEQRAAKLPRVGFLALGYGEPRTSNWFAPDLQALGWVDGKNVIFENRYADDKPERLPELASELVRLKVDVLVARGPGCICGEEGDEQYHRCQYTCRRRNRPARQPCPAGGNIPASKVWRRIST